MDPLPRLHVPDAMTWWEWLVVAWMLAFIAVAAVWAVRWGGCLARWPDDYDPDEGVGCAKPAGHAGPHVARSGYSWGWGR